jgi:hypothetical protein
MGTPDRIPEMPRPTRVLRSVPRTSDEREKADSLVMSFSIVTGGPIYDTLLRFGHVGQSLPNVARRIAAVVAVTWLPLLLLSLKERIAFGHNVTIPFLYDLSMYGRFWLALPLLFLAEVVIDGAIRSTLTEFVESHIVPDEELENFASILGSTQRLRDSWIPEFILLVLAFFPAFVFQHEWTAGVVSSWHTTASGLTAAGWWFAVFSGPLLRFVIYRWAFRYFLWALLLWRIKGLHLSLIPTHPDHAAGLGFIGMSQKHFGILFCAVGCIFASRIANSMLFERAPLISFKGLMVAFLAMSLIMGLLPLGLLYSKLRKVRTAGMLEYGRLAYNYADLFDRKWVHNAEPPAESMLGTSDVQALADMECTFASVDTMRAVPISKRLVLQLAAQASIPLVPVIVMGTPTPELVHGVMKMLV